jgi:NAD(P)-dependent dehydrogenase (short-subunit alcohol dehydrogenase family)
MSDDNILIIGATGVSGRNITRRLHHRGLPLTLAARNRDRLDEMADSLHGSRVIAADVESPDTLLDSVTLVVNTVGPFSTHAQSLRHACLERAIPYLDIANEHAAAEQLFALDSDARRQHIPMLTAVGFGPSVAEALLADVIADVGQPPHSVRLVTAPAGEVLSPALQATFADCIARGAIWLEGGKLRTAQFGSGSAAIRLGGSRRQVLLAPSADVLAANRISHAPNVNGYFAAPGDTHQPSKDSYVYVDAWWPDGLRRGRLARLGNGNDVSADIVTETISRMLANDPAAIAGTWTPIGLFGPGVVFEAASMEVSDVAPDEIWADTGATAS